MLREEMTPRSGSVDSATADVIRNAQQLTSEVVVGDLGPVEVRVRGACVVDTVQVGGDNGGRILKLRLRQNGTGS